MDKRAIMTYVILLQKEKITLNDIPKELQAEVKKELEKHQTDK